VGIEELRRDRDERIDILRVEIDDLTKTNEVVSKENAQLLVRVQTVEEIHSKLEEDYQRLNEHLVLANKVKSSAEEQLLELQKQYLTL
jgi:chromosome segregation ATPase